MTCKEEVLVEETVPENGLVTDAEQRISELVKNAEEYINKVVQDAEDRVRKAFPGVVPAESAPQQERDPLIKERDACLARLAELDDLIK